MPLSQLNESDPLISFQGPNALIALTHPHLYTPRHSSAHSGPGLESQANEDTSCGACSACGCEDDERWKQD